MNQRGGEMKVLKNMEWKRWLFTPVFPLIAVVCGILNVMDMNVTNQIVADRSAGQYQCVSYYFAFVDAFFGVAGLCLGTFTGAVLYAKDYAENAVYMRISRMGCRRYVFNRVFQTAAGSFLCGVCAIVISFCVFSYMYHTPFFPHENEIISGWTQNEYLLQGNYMAYFLVLIIISGLYYSFYALAALFFSLFVPNWKIMIAVPMITWFFNQFIIPGIKGIPIYMCPSFIFGINAWLADYLRISPLYVLLGILGGMAILICFIMQIFYFKLRGKGLFGGEEE